MGDVFISHAEEDEAIALEIAHGIRSAGYKAWLYEQDSLPGINYLKQTREAIEACRLFLLIVSSASLESWQIDKEVVRAHECGKPFLPVLLDLTHAEFSARRPEWAQAIGGATSVRTRRGEIGSVLPRILLGLKHARGDSPSGHVESKVAIKANPPPRPTARPGSTGSLPPRSQSTVRKGSPISRVLWPLAAVGCFLTIMIVGELPYKETPGTDEIEPSPSQVDSSSPLPDASAAQSFDIHQVDFRNFTYSLTGLCSGEVTLENGNFEEEWCFASLVSLVFGDLTGDDSDEAAVIIQGNGGGSGVSYELFVYTSHNGKPKLLAEFPQTGRADGYNAVRIEGGVLIVGRSFQGPDDPICCPSFSYDIHYRLSGDRFDEVARSQPIKDSDSG